MKMLKFASLFVVVCVLMACIGSTAFAASSKSSPVEVVPAEGVTVTEMQKGDPTLSKAEAARLAGLKEADCVELKQFNMTAKTPASLTIKVDVAKGHVGYVFHYDGKAWVKMGKVNEAITFNSLSPVAYAIFKEAATSNTSTSGKSPKTGDNGMLTSLALAAIVMGGAVAFFSKKN